MNDLVIKRPKKSKVIETKEQIYELIEEVLAEREYAETKRKIGNIPKSQEKLDLIDIKIEKLLKAKRLIMSEVV